MTAQAGPMSNEQIQGRVDAFVRGPRLVPDGHDVDHTCLIRNLRLGGWSTSAIGLVLGLSGDRVELLERAVGCGGCVSLVRSSWSARRTSG